MQKKEHFLSLQSNKTEHYDRYATLITVIRGLLAVGDSVVAVDGGSASGKTTLAEVVLREFDCNVIHMDDFFLRVEQRTPERYAEVGGNVDRERFLEEVLLPLSKGERVSYRKFDCKTMTLSAPVTLEPKPLTIVEGAYSLHTELTDYYDFTVFLDISSELQRARIEKRNDPKVAERFFGEWIPLENEYFTKSEIKKRADLVLKIT